VRPPIDEGQIRGELSMGDALVAARLLGPSDDDGYAAILGFLDLALIAPAAVERTGLSPRLSRPADRRDEVAADDEELDLETTAETGGTPLAAQLHELDAGADAPEWLLDPGELEPATRARLSLDPDPPLPAVQARAALAASAAVLSAGRRLDVPRLVRRAARLRPLTPPPLVLELRTAPAVQLLIDQGEGMEPFGDDCAFLAAQLEDVAGRDRVERHWFVRTPLQGVDPDPLQDTRTRWKIPPGALVLVISDLGIGGPIGSPDRGSPREWQRVAAEVIRHDGLLRVLTPFGPDHVPRGLAAVADVVGWDALANLGLRRA
jgi:hypothetical protein